MGFKQGRFIKPLLNISLFLRIFSDKDKYWNFNDYSIPSVLVFICSDVFLPSVVKKMKHVIYDFSWLVIWTVRNRYSSIIVK